MTCVAVDDDRVRIGGGRVAGIAPWIGDRGARIPRIAGENLKYRGASEQ
jgi:hypothetical protein